jgi:ribosome-associated protein
MSRALTITSTLVIPARELEWTAVRSGGPGGQNVNKLSTKVELRFDVTASAALTSAVKARLLARAASRLDAGGKLLVTADTTRSQSQNLELARERLAELVRAALVAPKKRRPTRPSRAARERRLETKRQVSEKKRSRKAEL